LTYDFWVARKTNLFSSNDFDTRPDANVTAVTSLGVVASNQATDNVSGHQAAVGKSDL
jgi:hypothetical protein